jgi:putative PEP-CTERM system integral membrane protein
MNKLLHLIFHAIFWGWNFTFLAIVYLGILPLIGIPLVIATFSGDVPSEFFLTLVALVAVPTACTAFGFGRFRQSPLQLFRLFYCVEAPLFLLCLLRLFLLRELTPASHFILLAVSIVILAFLGEMIYGYAWRNRTLAWVQLAAHSLMLLIGVYVGLLLLFYAIPVTVPLVSEFLKFEWLSILWDAIRYNWFSNAFLLIPLFLIFWGITCSLFVVMPLVVTSQYIYGGQRVLRRFATQYGRRSAFAVPVTVCTVSLILFFAFQQQPQVKAFSLLARPPQTDSARQALLAQSETILTGLVNAYLFNYRYLSSEQDNNHIKVLYQNVFNLPEAIAQGIQNAYNALMSPFLYKGTASDLEKAEKLYAEFFDTSIQKGERTAINHALQSTFNRDEAKAGLLNFNQQKVWLRSQEITLQEQGDWAEIELHEVYDNQTRDTQEVFYSFSLPESAVITGLWLGDTAERTKRFEFVVSPRGAAQQVYNDQVRWQLDPALLEQVGSRHYRLRAFPVPPRLMAWERREQPERPTEMHLWLTYKVMRQEKGWALPQLGEKRNIYWTKNTQRLRNGKVSEKKLAAWVEDYLPASQPYQPQLHQAQLAGDYQITAKPLTEKDYSLPQNQRFAIILDTSRSMKARIKELSETFTWLKAHGFDNNNLADNEADLYLTASSGAVPKRMDEINPLNPAKMTFYGTVQLNSGFQLNRLK